MKAPLPQIISSAALRELASPNDTHAVRVVMLKTSAPTQYRFRGVRRQYIFERDGMLGRHIIDIPVSLWQQDAPDERYGDNTSLAHDLMSKMSPLTPFVILIVPWKDGEVPEQVKDSSVLSTAPDFITPLRKFAEMLQAPPVFLEAFALATGENTEALEAFVGKVELSKPVINLDDDGEEDDAPSEEGSVSTPEPSATTPEAPASPDEAQNPPVPPATEKPLSKAAIRMRNKRARDRKKKAEALALHGK